jgi:DNA-binding NarL/FixJ family response regulator
VDDHAVVRSGLAQLINLQPDLVVCGEADDAPVALSRLANLRPQIAIVDISLKKDVSGIELIKTLADQYPKLLVLVLSMYDEAIFAERALRAGARGYVMKAEAPEILLKAIRAVLRGEIFVSDAFSKRIVSQTIGARSGASRLPQELLTDRELQVLQSLGQGLGAGRIASKLRLSVKTVETYRTRIRQKLNIPDAAALLEFAVQWVRSLERN